MGEIASVYPAFAKDLRNCRVATPGLPELKSLKDTNIQAPVVAWHLPDG